MPASASAESGTLVLWFKKWCGQIAGSGVRKQDNDGPALVLRPLGQLQGGGHGGSPPHLVHEFVRSILEDRDPVPSDIDGAYWTGVGICAHQSAMEGGVLKTVPVFE